jgi:hypothetical protein
MQKLPIAHTADPLGQIDFAISRPVVLASGPPTGTLQA